MDIVRCTPVQKTTTRSFYSELITLANKNKDVWGGASQNVSPIKFPGRRITKEDSQTVTTRPPGPLRVQTHLSETDTLQWV